MDPYFILLTFILGGILGYSLAKAERYEDDE